MTQVKRKMTKKQRERAGQIRRELSAMSRNSWQDAKPCDYQPLEKELRELEDNYSYRRGR